MSTTQMEYAGDSGVVTTPGKYLTTLSGPAYKAVQVIPGARPVRQLTLYAPDGSSPDAGTIATLATNTHVVMVGPNEHALFPLDPGVAVTFEQVDPANIAIDDLGNSGQHVFFFYGGPDP